MELRQVKGHTWVLEGFEYIPIYRIDQHKCIFLDTGLAQERQDIIEAIEQYALEPVGVLCSHAHVDHGGNNRFLQETYGIPVAMTAAEAGMCVSLLTLKCYFLLLTPETVEREAAGLVQHPDVIVPPENGKFSFVGVDFEIIHTPGHSAGHIVIVTPDKVCYVGDALLSVEMMGSKLPYSLSHKQAAVSRQRLRDISCEKLIMAHRGVAEGSELPSLIDQNDALLAQRAAEIQSLVVRPMTASEISRAVCNYYELFTKKTSRSLRFERNIRFFIEYLVDEGRLFMSTEAGVTKYSQLQ